MIFHPPFFSVDIWVFFHFFALRNKAATTILMYPSKAHLQEFLQGRYQCHTVKKQSNSRDNTQLFLRRLYHSVLPQQCSYISVTPYFATYHILQHIQLQIKFYQMGIKWHLLIYHFLLFLIQDLWFLSCFVSKFLILI